MSLHSSKNPFAVSNDAPSLADLSYLHRSRLIHKQRLKKTKAMVDNKPPVEYNHLKHNAKKQQMVKEHQDKIYRENMQMVAKMRSLLRPSQTNDQPRKPNDVSLLSEISTPPPPAPTLHAVARAIRNAKINRDNERMYHRLLTVPPVHQRKQWAQNAEDKRKMATNACKFPYQDPLGVRPAPDMDVLFEFGVVSEAEYQRYLCQQQQPSSSPRKPAGSDKHNKDGPIDTPSAPSSSQHPHPSPPQSSASLQPRTGSRTQQRRLEYLQAHGHSTGDNAFAQQSLELPTARSRAWRTLARADAVDPYPHSTAAVTQREDMRKRKPGLILNPVQSLTVGQLRGLFAGRGAPGEVLLRGKFTMSGIPVSVIVRKLVRPNVMEVRVLELIEYTLYEARIPIPQLEAMGMKCDDEVATQLAEQLVQGCSLVEEDGAVELCVDVRGPGHDEGGREREGEGEGKVLELMQSTRYDEGESASLVLPPIHRDAHRREGKDGTGTGTGAEGGNGTGTGMGDMANTRTSSPQGWSTHSIAASTSTSTSTSAPLLYHSDPRFNGAYLDHHNGPPGNPYQSRLPQTLTGVALRDAHSHYFHELQAQKQSGDRAGEPSAVTLATEPAEEEELVLEALADDVAFTAHTHRLMKLERLQAMETPLAVQLPSPTNEPVRVGSGSSHGGSSSGLGSQTGLTNLQVQIDANNANSNTNNTNSGQSPRFARSPSNAPPPDTRNRRGSGNYAQSRRRASAMDPGSPVAARRGSVAMHAAGTALFFNDLGNLDLSRRTERERKPRRKRGVDPGAGEAEAEVEVGVEEEVAATDTSDKAPRVIAFTGSTANLGFQPLVLPLPAHAQGGYDYTAENDYLSQRDFGLEVAALEAAQAAASAAEADARVEAALAAAEHDPHAVVVLRVRVGCADVCAECVAASVAEDACMHQSVAVHLYYRSGAEEEDAEWEYSEQCTETIPGNTPVFSQELELMYRPGDAMEFAFMVVSTRNEENTVIGTAAATPEALIEARTLGLPLVDMSGGDHGGVVTVQAIALEYAQMPTQG